MAYNWAQLAFVEKWRLQAVRGHIVGMHRPADKTFFDLRLRPGEGNVGAIPTSLDLHLQDAGDIIREKRLVLLANAAVVVRVVASSAAPDAEASSPQRPRKPLEAGSSVSGTLRSIEDDTALVDVGFPVVVQFPEPVSGLKTGESVRVAVAETPKGFLVV